MQLWSPNETHFGAHEYKVQINQRLRDEYVTFNLIVSSHVPLDWIELRLSISSPDFLGKNLGLAMNQIAVNLSRRNWSKKYPESEKATTLTFTVCDSENPPLASSSCFFCGIYKEICLCHLLIFLAPRFFFFCSLFPLIGSSLLICVQSFADHGKDGTHWCKIGTVTFLHKK